MATWPSGLRRRLKEVPGTCSGVVGGHPAVFGHSSSPGLSCFLRSVIGGNGLKRGTVGLLFERLNAKRDLVVPAESSPELVILTKFEIPTLSSRHSLTLSLTISVFSSKLTR
ncbi:hypothetical protein PGT21_011100 [Puccinia graminis f. sp. tritici]|uniref:Uncharacterized protein n=1 Tax=Puccinia graminis f. sp. tritici TaxID=56615 RepID=A0A5B0QML8_PUCGR|nr:hypothetical protein PGT21_011100 [Puccinia graminis f. sp. tritici]